MHIDSPIIRRVLEQRVIDLHREITEIQEALNGRPQKRQKAATESPVVEKRKRPKMPAAQRKAVGERMREYWANRKRKG